MREGLSGPLSACLLLPLLQHHVLVLVLVLAVLFVLAAVLRPSARGAEET
jgi:hypothetical protein